ncbi:hypothetical protein OsI_32803 [Oryza sativa Indica Group]|uniref:SHSP domain-containing protein n=1 Tax=Oryza sativa subsp. indica TaxID=39946 RepID=B8BFT0_ORYSI|nr:hypothetical protein OsI_32803 [Oryza sativa Indica Group]
MAPLLFAVLVLATALHGVVGQEAGFLSIDCGLEISTSSYKADDTGIIYVSDGSYVDTGENRRISDEEEGWQRRYTTLRSFPSGVRNCYALPTVAGAKYLVRVVSVYGNYDGKNSSSAVQFDMHLGANHWVTVNNPTGAFNEAMFVAWASWAPVCLVNTGSGTPFVNTVELRMLSSELYPTVMANQSMKYPYDRYDRRWWLMRSDPTWKNLTTASTIKESSDYAVPLPIIETAIEVISNKTAIEQASVGTVSNDAKLIITRQYRAPMEYKVFMHFADFQNTEQRQFNVSINEQESFLVRPSYLVANTLHILCKANGGVCTMTLTANSDSMLGPMLNAFEVYTIISRDNPTTFPRDSLLYQVPPPEGKERWEIKDDEGNVQLWLQVPGLTEDDLEITTTDELLEIKRKAGRGDPRRLDDVQGVGSFHLRLLLTKEFVSSQVTAELKAGMLEVTIPKNTNLRRTVVRIGQQSQSPAAVRTAQPKEMLLFPVKFGLVTTY